MDAEPEQLDAREIKVLADILALVLQDDAGPSAAALETLRRKARQNRITGGALKNLFQSLSQSDREVRSRTPLPDSPAGMQLSIERLRATNRTLEKALASANGEAARLLSELEQVQARLSQTHQMNRSLAERWRTVRKRVGLMGAGLAACMFLILALVADRLITRSPAPASFTSAGPSHATAPAEAGQNGAAGIPARPPHESVAVRPGTPEPNSSAAASERDPELEQALKRLSGGPQQQDSASEANVPATPATLSPPPSPARAGNYLSPDVYSGIITHVRTCWRTYVGRLGDVRFQARMQVVADEGGVVREARLAPEDTAHLADPAYQNFVRAAMHSVLDPSCAQLPIPPAQLGHRIAFDFVFVP